MESEGITIVGDFAVITGEEGGLVLELKEGSTGTFSYGEDSVDMTWELVDDNTIHAAKAEDADEDAGDDEAVHSGKPVQHGQERHNCDHTELIVTHCTTGRICSQKRPQMRL